MDDTDINKPPSAPSSAEKSETGRKMEEKSASEGLKQSTETASAVDAVGSVSEGLEDVDGRVTETLSEDRKKSSGGSKCGTKTTVVGPEAIRAQILKSIPTEKVMRQQVSREIRREIKYLHKKAMKMMRSPGDVSFFEMSNLMRKLRELKGLLAALLKASLEGLKTLWLRFVHGAT